jgi:hypothetical protein
MPAQIEIVGRDFDVEYEPVKSFGWCLKRTHVEVATVHDNLNNF